MNAHEMAQRALVLDEKATEGPWELFKLDDAYYAGTYVIGNIKESPDQVPEGVAAVRGIACCAGCNLQAGCPEPSEADEHFITEARTLLPALAKAYLELEAKYEAACKLERERWERVKALGEYKKKERDWKP